jgi:hypothetical protein
MKKRISLKLLVILGLSQRVPVRAKKTSAVLRGSKTRVYQLVEASIVGACVQVLLVNNPAK